MELKQEQIRNIQHRYEQCMARNNQLTDIHKIDIGVSLCQGYKRTQSSIKQLDKAEYFTKEKSGYDLFNTNVKTLEFALVVIRYHLSTCDGLPEVPTKPSKLKTLYAKIKNYEQFSTLKMKSMSTLIKKLKMLKEAYDQYNVEKEYEIVREKVKRKRDHQKEEEEEEEVKDECDYGDAVSEEASEEVVSETIDECFESSEEEVKQEEEIIVEEEDEDEAQEAEDPLGPSIAESARARRHDPGDHRSAGSGHPRLPDRDERVGDHHRDSDDAVLATYF